MVHIITNVCCWNPVVLGQVWGQACNKAQRKAPWLLALDLTKTKIEQDSVCLQPNKVRPLQLPCSAFLWTGRKTFLSFPFLRISNHSSLGAHASPTG